MAAVKDKERLDTVMAKHFGPVHEGGDVFGGGETEG